MLDVGPNGVMYSLIQTNLKHSLIFNSMTACHFVPFPSTHTRVFVFVLLIDFEHKSVYVISKT
jgi:hypothetical protein